MNRHRLDAFCRLHRLPAPSVAAALDLTGNRPDAAAWRSFAAQVLRAAGLGAIGTGVVFFVAANWQDYGVMGRFALLQVGLLVCIAAALWRPPPGPIGQSALILATLLTGALLALFGQTYQTGADVHELFFAWALLALPFAVSALSGALWALWFGVLNVGLALVCGSISPQHIFWRMVADWHIDRSLLLMLPCLVDLVAAAAVLALRTTRFRAAAPLWLARFLTAIGLACGTFAVLMVVVGRSSHPRMPLEHDQGPVVLLVFALLCAAIAVATLRSRRDVFPMALLAASAIAISTTWLATAMELNDFGAFLVIALWLIGTSTGAGLALMHWLRSWRIRAAQGVPA